MTPDTRHDADTAGRVLVITIGTLLLAAGWAVAFLCPPVPLGRFLLGFAITATGAALIVRLIEHTRQDGTS